MVACVGFLSACSLIWSDPARSSFRNLHVHPSPRQVEVLPRTRVLREWGDGNGGYGAIVRRTLQDVLGSAVKVDWVVIVSSQRVFCLIEVASVLEGSC